MSCVHLMNLLRFTLSASLMTQGQTGYGRCCNSEKSSLPQPDLQRIVAGVLFQLVPVFPVKIGNSTLACCKKKTKGKQMLQATPSLLCRAGLCLCRGLGDFLENLRGVPALLQWLKVLLARLPVHLCALRQQRLLHGQAPTEA